ncbi:MAG TPA: hypothetical protein VL995_20725 [Cellvibrio sp.]|nr:hypothetical protein [Cellvibrio sp.]
MFRILTDVEVALNELLVESQKTVDHFRDATQLINDRQMALEFKRIADIRKIFISQIEAKIREFGDLPTMPDPDKEDGEILLHHLGAAITEDYSNKILEQRMEADKNIKQLIQKLRDVDNEDSCSTLSTEFATHVDNTLKKLSSLVTEVNN